jgi:hypothetical protein
MTTVIRSTHTLRQTLRAGTLAVLGAVALTGCDTGPLSTLVDDLEVRLEVPGLNTMMSVMIVDGATRNPILGDVRVTVTGADALSVIDPIFYEAIGTTTTPSGLLVLGVADNRPPSVGSPVRFNLFISAPGFVSTSYSIALDQPGTPSFEVPLVRAQTPPEGVAVVTQAGAVSNTGATTTALTVVTPNEPQSGAAASVQIPSGTVLVTAAGTPLQGQVSAQVAYFNNQSESSLSAFPGGFDLVRPVGYPEGAFITAGFASVNITDGQGRRAANLSNAATITMGIAPGTMNPLTGALVRPGDEIPLWSLEPESGAWLYEGTQVLQTPAQAARMGAVVPHGLESGALVASFATTHFTYYALNWFTTDVCAEPEAVRFTLNRDPGADFYIRIMGDGRQSQTPGITPTGPDQRVWVYGLPRAVQPSAPGIPGEWAWSVRRSSDDVLLANGTLRDFICGTRVEVNLPTFAERLEADLTISVMCEKNGRTTALRPTYVASYREEGADRWNQALLRRGVVRLNGLEIGKRYDVGITVKEGGRSSFEIRTLLFDLPGSSIGMGPDVRQTSFEQVRSDFVRASYRVSNIQAICNVI